MTNFSPYYDVINFSPKKSLETDSFAGLNGLRELDLSGNEISTLPDGVFQPLGQLKKLTLRRNEISLISTKSLVGLTGLQYLDLTSNWIASVHPDAFSDLPIGFKVQVLPKIDSNTLNPKVTMSLHT